MSHKFHLHASFHLLLIKIDQELAEEFQSKGCPYCKGPLDVSNYPRSPFGLPAYLREHYEYRFSFCCRNCRKRTTPASVRFFGCHWYVFPIYLLFNLFQLGITERRLEQIRNHLHIDVSESTWKRWRRWWNQTFISTPFCQQARGYLSIPTQWQGSLPRRLLRQFSGTFKARFVGLSKFLSPLTGGNLRAV